MDVLSQAHDVTRKGMHARPRITARWCRPWSAGFGVAVAVLGGCVGVSASPVPNRSAAADSAARAAIASERTISPAAFPAASVAVVPFPAVVRDTQLAVLGYGLADLLVTDLARSRQVQMVERLRVDALLREMQLAASGRVDSATAPRVGRLAGARRLVVGDVTQLPDGRIRVSTRIANTLSGTVAAPGANVTPLDRILDAEKAIAFDLFARMGVTLTPVERAAIEQRPTRSLAAFLAYSRGVRAEVLGDYRRAEREFREAVRLDPGFSQAGVRVTDVAGLIDVSLPTARFAGPRLRNVTLLATDALTPPLVRRPADASDPAFQATDRKVTVIVVVDIP